MARGGKRSGAGAPAGNTNALKHGLYSDRLVDVDQVRLFFKALAVDNGLAGEIALLRVLTARGATSDIRELLGPIAVLARALTVQRRLAQARPDDLVAAAAGVIEHFKDILPEGG